VGQPIVPRKEKNEREALRKNAMRKVRKVYIYIYIYIFLKRKNENSTTGQKGRNWKGE